MIKISQPEVVKYHPLMWGFALYILGKDKTTFQLYNENEQLIHEKITPLY